MCDEQPSGNESGGNGHSPTLSRAQALTLCFVIAAAASIVVTFVAAPRLAVWRDLHVEGAQFNPEVNRAVATLQQLDDPFLSDTDLGLTNLGIKWRLFFPLLAHYTQLPDSFFLAIPHIGCVLTLALVAGLAWRETRSWWLSLLVTILAAACPWYFVSTGWLTYFDSWWVLGLLVAALVRSRTALIAACLITPWIDERFVIGLPLAVVVRSIYLYGPGPQKLRAWLKDVAIVTAPILPYIILRLIAMTGQDATAQHFTNEWKRIHDATPLQFGAGVWSGYRTAWVFVAAFIPLAWIRQPRLTWSLVVPGILLTTTAAIVIAADMSRGLMMLMPVLLAGCLLLLRDRRRLGRRALLIATVANLLLPASHVLWYFTVPIDWLPHELTQLETPAEVFHAQYADNYVQEGIALDAQGEVRKAYHFFSTAIKLAPQLPDAHVYRGLMAMKMGNHDAASQDIAKALEIAPDFADGHFARGVLNLKIGNREAARKDLQRALDVGGEAWQRRADCQRLLDSL